MKKRDASIELWRIFCMLAVVVSHVASTNKVLDFSWFFWHIPGFLLISGFFGVRFSLMKIIRLLGVCYACNWLTMPFRPGATLASALSPCGGWYVGFYIVLIMLAPLMNSVVEDRKRLKTTLISLGCLLFFAMLPRFLLFPQAGFFRVDGMVDRGILFIFVIYIFARVVRQYDEWLMETLMKRRLWILLSFVLMIIVGRVTVMMFPLSCVYMNPVAMVTAVIGFYAIRLYARNIPRVAERVILFISPSMFGVYLVHAGGLWQYQFAPEGSNVGIGWVALRSAELFGVGLLIDLARRGFVTMCTRLFRRCKCCPS